MRVIVSISHFCREFCEFYALCRRYSIISFVASLSVRPRMRCHRKERFVCERGTIFYGRYMKGVHFLSEMGMGLERLVKGIFVNHDLPVLVPMK